MGVKTARLAPSAGRKSAYVARNRIALLEATQDVLASIGPEATIDEVAEHAGVSVSTIYKHFETKESLFTTALVSAMTDWQEWALAKAEITSDPLEQLIIPMRLLLRIKQTHPKYAKMIANNFSNISAQTPALSSGLLSHVKKLHRAGILKIDHVELRVRNFSACMLEGTGHQLLNPVAKLAEADISVEIALGMLGISDTKAKKLAHEPLPRLEVVQN
jgi:AcrR family transcriptional regulator